MKGTGVFLKKYTGRGILLGMLTIILLQLSGVNTAALAQTCGQWRVISSPNVGSGTNSLYGVTAISPDDVWAVGTTANATLTEHWNGQKWKLVTSASNGAQLTGVAAISANDIWAVGTIGTYAPIIEHWNGKQWRVVPNPNSDTSMYAVTAVSTNDVWAVGYTLLHNSKSALIEHWDGKSWSLISNPRLPNSCFPEFAGVVALSTRNVWVVGSDWGNCYDSPPYSLTENWNGTQWNFVHSPDDKGNLTGQLSGVAAASSNNVWAVGGLYDQQIASTYHWDGSHWHKIANPILPFSQLNGVAATSAGDFWAVGTYSPPNSYNQTLIEFYC